MKRIKHRVRGTAEVAGENADGASDQDRHERGEEADPERDAASRDQQREHVAAAVVGAEPERAARWRVHRPHLLRRVVRLEPRCEDRDEDEETEDAEADHRSAVPEEGRPHESGPARLRNAVREAVLVRRLQRLDQAHAVTRGSNLKYSRSARRLKKITDSVSSMKIACRSGKSRLSIASTVSSPRPG